MPMAINVACPSCGRQYSVKDDSAGKRFKCKDCEAVVEVPAVGSDAADDDYGDPYGAVDDAGMDMPAPVTGRRRMSPPSVAAPEVTSRTQIPAICMYVVCGISIGNSVIRLALEAMGMAGPLPQFGEAQVQLGHVFVFVIVGLFIARDLFLIYAFSRMHKATDYNIAMAGAVISVIPCLGSPCCLLGIPFGIWALVVLNDPAVKAGFR
jgi:hypothetical protein